MKMMRTYFLILLLAGITPARAIETSEVEIDDGVQLIFQYSSSGGDQLRKLVLHSDEKKETIWDSHSSEPVLIEDRVAPGEYKRVELMSASMDSGIITALFRLSPGRQFRVPVHMMAPDYFSSPRGLLSENDFIVRNFIREGRGWVPYLSFYPETFFGDLAGESVEDIIIIDMDSIDLKYRGSWRIVGRDEFINEGPFKYRQEKGHTVKKFRYSPEQDLLFILDDGNNKKYIKGSLWWTGLRDFDFGDSTKGNEVFSLMQKERKKTIMKLGIEIEDRRFFSPVPKEESGRFRDYVKYLEGQESANPGASSNP